MWDLAVRLLVFDQDTQAVGGDLRIEVSQPDCLEASVPLIMRTINRAVGEAGQVLAELALRRLGVEDQRLHAVRMGEGKNTRIDPEVRFKTIKAARETGLWVGTCVEPIGPEHSVEEIAEKILIGRKMNPCYSGAARRRANASVA